MPDAQPSFWSRWHDGYEQPDSNLSQRLSVVQERVREAIDRMPGPLRLISVCAGQGRDVIGVLADHPRRTDVSAFLVELDEHNVGVARALAADAGFEELAFDSPGEDRFAVGTHRLVAEPLGFRGDLRMFTFIE